MDGGVPLERKAAMTWDPFAPPKPITARGRIERRLTDDEDDPPDNKPDIVPYLAGSATGDVIANDAAKTGRRRMPKGVYDRSKRAAAATGLEAPPAPRKPGPKPRAAIAAAKVAAPSVKSVQGRFDVSLDLRQGAVTINAASGSLTLQPDEVAALFAFLGRR
jgi:hypothetical protein